jgi:hypothetical protein
MKKVYHFWKDKDVYDYETFTVFATSEQDAIERLKKHFKSFGEEFDVKEYTSMEIEDLDSNGGVWINP